MFSKKANMGNRSIINSVEPINPQDAATKKYVDNKLQISFEYWGLSGIKPMGVGLTAFFGTKSDSDIQFVRNNQPYFV